MIMDLREVNFHVENLRGMSWSPLENKWQWSNNVDCNYLIHAKRWKSIFSVTFRRTFHKPYAKLYVYHTCKNYTHISHKLCDITVLVLQYTAISSLGFFGAYLVWKFRAVKTKGLYLYSCECIVRILFEKWINFQIHLQSLANRHRAVFYHWPRRHRRLIWISNVVFRLWYKMCHFSTLT